MIEHAYYNHMEALCANGFDVVPLKGKRPFTKAWQEHDFCEDGQPRKALKQNIGIKTGRVVAIDLDVMDEDLVEQLLQLAMTVLGDAPVRVGKPPKALAVYRTDTPLKKILLRHGQEGEQIEVLGQGQQFVALGIHPDTERPFTWDEDLLEITYDSLTPVTEGQLRDYLRKAAKLLGVDETIDGGGVATAKASGDTVGLPEEDPFLEALRDGGFAERNPEAGKYYGACPLGEEHANGKVDGFVYWQAGYHGSLLPNAHCSHASHAGLTLADFEEVLGAKAPERDMLDSMAKLGKALVEHNLTPEEVRKYPETPRDVRRFVHSGILPDLTMNRSGVAANQRATKENVRAVLETIGARVRYNELTLIEEVDLPWLSSTRGYHLNKCYTDIVDACLYARINNSGQVKEMIDAIAHEHRYHPFRDYLAGLRWDGRSRLEELADTVALAEPHERPLWEAYLKRFLVQIVEGTIAPRPRQMRGLLLFCGKQNIGKTWWFSRLVGKDYFRDGVSVGSNTTGERDFLMSSTGYVLVELGEIDATFRKVDQSHLKALLTRESDTYRAPYAAKVNTYPRRVSYCGTVNDIACLVDPTGNTRFWPIEVVSINNTHRIDMGQVWAEAVHMWRAGESLYLSAEEEALRAKGEYKYRALSLAERMVEEYFTEQRMSTDQGGWTGNTCTDVCRALGVPLTRRELNDMGHALKHLTGKDHSGDRRVGGKQKAWLLPLGAGIDSTFFQE